MARPFSSSSDKDAVAGLFDGVLARGPVLEAVSDHAWLGAMLDVEAALARANALAGLISTESAEAIGRACRADDYDLAALGREAAAAGNPVVPLVAAIRRLVGGTAADAVHLGATSQDVLDTAGSLVARSALDLLLSDLGGASGAAAALADGHRGTLMAGRTLLQQALPITFGLKAAGWMAGLDAAMARLEEVSEARLAVQLGGAAGTLAALDGHGLKVLAHLAEELGLAEPALAWHTERTRVAELAGALGEAAGAVGKPARDVILLAQTEVGEVREGTPGRGGSSTLPHKQNPVAAVSALACAIRAPGLVSTLLVAMVQEHERAAGAWHAEWFPLRELLISVGSAAAWLRDCLEHLRVDRERMRANLDRDGGLMLSERVVAALVPAIGREDATTVVSRATETVQTSGRPFADVLSEDPIAGPHLEADQIADLLDPAGYLGSTDLLIDRALIAHRDGTALPRRP
jgi:3-carboxy-cis,cis-muconate cycloisomerase